MHDRYIIDLPRKVVLTIFIVWFYKIKSLSDNSVLVSIQKLLKSDLVEPGKTETRLKLQADHRKNLREFDKKIVTELDEKVVLSRQFLYPI